MRAIALALSLGAAAFAAACGGTATSELIESGDEVRGRPAPAGVNPTVLPIRSLTPGAVLTTDVRVIRQPGYARTVRNVTSQEKAAVAAAYRYTGPSSGVEYDHLVSLELGGSNDQTNLWPQPIAEAHIKDRLENYLRAQVVAGRMSLPDVQRRIATDWIKLWNDVGRP